ncbi:hypothetical protein ISCGN_029654 [Ixodes scapularis]
MVQFFSTDHHQSICTFLFPPNPPPPPPPRRDITEAFQHVQQTARHSSTIGKREVTKLQYLELFVEVWDCRCLGLSHRAKLKIFDRVRLLYHVAQAGWSAALESYADPSATLLLDSPAARRVPATCNPSPERPSETEPRSDRDITKSQRAARAGSPKKNKNEDPESELLPPHLKEPEDCQPLLHHLEATDGVVEFGKF